MKRVILESPFSGDVAKNMIYLRRCLHDSLSRGEAPIASHGLYTQPGVLDDNNPQERQWGIDAGLVWHATGVKSVVYTDYGISKGMEYGIKKGEEHGSEIEYRQIGPNPSLIDEPGITLREAQIKLGSWIAGKAIRSADMFNPDREFETECLALAEEMFKFVDIKVTALSDENDLLKAELTALKQKMAQQTEQEFTSGLG